MSSDLATSQTTRVRQFSLRQALIAILGLAIGFAIWRSPQGNWLDIPVWMLSFYFVISLERHAAAQRRMIADASGLSREQRWGARLKLWGLIGLAITLIVSCLLRFFAGNELLLVPQHEISLDYVRYPTLPRDIAILAMLVALSNGRLTNSPSTKTPRQHIFYKVVAAIGLLLAIFVYWVDHMVVVVLVYLAVSGIELSQPARIVQPEANISTAIRAHRFVLGSAAGVSILVPTLALIFTLLKWWKRRVTRWAILPLVILGLASQCYVVYWFATVGIHQLQTEFENAFNKPSVAGVLAIGMLAAIPTAVAAWRIALRPGSSSPTISITQLGFFFYESWQAAALVGLCGAARLIQSLIGYVLRDIRNPKWGGQIHWETIAYSLVNNPSHLLWWAAAIGGLSVAWVRWRNRAKPVVETIPEIDPVQFSVLFVMLLVATLVAAPIIAAASFSYGLTRYPRPF